LIGLGITPAPGTPEKFSDEMKGDLAHYGAVIKVARIKAE